MMFYCEACRVRNKWPESIGTSSGRCEVCGKGPRVCYDVPSSALPVPPSGIKGKLPKTAAKTLAKRLLAPAVVERIHKLAAKREQNFGTCLRDVALAGIVQLERMERKFEQPDSEDTPA